METSNKLESKFEFDRSLAKFPDNMVISPAKLNKSGVGLNTDFGGGTQPTSMVAPTLIKDAQGIVRNLSLGKRKMPKITPAVAFKLSDEDGNGELTIEEFHCLLEDWVIFQKRVRSKYSRLLTVEMVEQLHSTSLSTYGEN